MTNQTPFGTFITIDGIVNGPKFTFWLQWDDRKRPPCNGQQYNLVTGDSGDWRCQFSVRDEDLEVGSGYLTLWDYEAGGLYRHFVYYVDFYHDGDPVKEVWGFTLHQLSAVDPSDIDPAPVTAQVIQ